MSTGTSPPMLRSLASRAAHMPLSLIGRVAEARKRRHCVVGDGSILLTTSRIDNHLGTVTAIQVGKDCRIAGQLLVFAHGGKITIGDDCFVGEGSRLWSAASIRVGSRVLISHGVNVHDTNSHSISAAQRHSHILAIFDSGHPRHLPDVVDAPVVIEDDAWIGFNAVVLKGVRIGRGAIVGSATVVTKDVPPFSVVVGNPAREIGQARP